MIIMITRKRQLMDVKLEDHDDNDDDDQEHDKYDNYDDQETATGGCEA